MEIYQKQYISADEIPFALNEAFSLFNSTFDTNYSLSNVKVSQKCSTISVKPIFLLG